MIETRARKVYSSCIRTTAHLELKHSMDVEAQHGSKPLLLTELQAIKLGKECLEQTKPESLQGPELQLGETCASIESRSETNSSKMAMSDSAVRVASAWSNFP